MVRRVPRTRTAPDAPWHRLIRADCARRLHWQHNQLLANARSLSPRPLTPCAPLRSDLHIERHRPTAICCPCLTVFRQLSWFATRPARRAVRSRGVGEQVTPASWTAHLAGTLPFPGVLLVRIVSTPPIRRYGCAWLDPQQVSSTGCACSAGARPDPARRWCTSIARAFARSGLRLQRAPAPHGRPGGVRRIRGRATTN